MIRLALVAVAAFAALPPGYEDKLLCPAGYCKRGKKMPAGWAGPRSAFHECYNKATDDVRSVTPWGSKNGGQLRLTSLSQSGFTETECATDSPTKVSVSNDCVDLMHDKTGGKNYCKTHLIPEYGCKHGIALHGCKKSCNACGAKKAKLTGGCCVSYGFGAFMKECCHQYTTVNQLGSCNTSQRMGGATVFEGTTCEASQIKHEGPQGCCVDFGLGARMKEVGHKYHAGRQSHCKVGNRMGGKTVFEQSDCAAARLKHEGPTVRKVSAQDPGCCVSFGYGARMTPCCHRFSAMKRGTCVTGRRMGGATTFELSYDKNDACAASKLKVKKMLAARRGDDSN